MAVLLIFVLLYRSLVPRSLFKQNSFLFSSKGMAVITTPKLRDNNQPKTQIVEAVVGVVVDANRGAAELSVVAPTAAAKHAVGAR